MTTMAEIMALKTDDRRKFLRRLVTDSLPHPDAATLQHSVSHSPIVGDGERQIGVRPQFSAVRDNLPEEVLLGLLKRTISWNDVLNAIKSPSTHGVPNTSTKTGYAFGWPSVLTTQAVDAIASYFKQDQTEWTARPVPAAQPAPAAPANPVLTMHVAPLVQPGIIAKPAKSRKSTKGNQNMTAQTQVEVTIDSLVSAFDLLVGTRLQNIKREIEAEGISKFDYANASAIVKAEVLAQFATKMGQEKANSFGALLMDRKDNGAEPNYLDAMSSSDANVIAMVDDIRNDHAAYYTASQENTTVSKTTAAAAPAAVEIEIKPEFESLLNLSLAQATGGKFTEAKQLVALVKDATAQANSKQAEIDRLKTVLLNRPASAAPTAVAHSTSGGIPAGKIVSKSAADIFVGPGGKRSKALDFDVQVIEWDGPNPYVPMLDVNYRFKPGKLLQFLFALKDNKKAWLHGHTGTGKTTFVEQVCARLGYMFMRVNLDSEITRMDLIGRDTLKTEHGQTISEFVEGILPTAMTLGGIGAVLCCDEVSFGRPDVMYVFQRALEDKGLLLTEDGGRVVHPGPMFRIVATDNTRGQGDEFGAYQGARPQSSAFLDRFTVWIEFEYMKPDEEKGLLMDLVPGLDPNDADQMAKFAKEMREAFKGGEIYQTLSPRGLVSLAEGYAFFLGVTKSRETAVELAADTTVLAKASDQDRAVIRGLYDRCFK